MSAPNIIKILIEDDDNDFDTLIKYLKMILERLDKIIALQKS